jgi:hypothetical protein
MFVLMLDLRFKNLQLVQHYVGLELAMQVVIEYDQGVMMPLLLLVYKSRLKQILVWLILS